MNQIEIIGLGSSDIEQMPLGIYRKLTGTDQLFLRTKDHPVVQTLEDEGVEVISFDDVYESHDTFEAVYMEIVDRLIETARYHEVVYAVPGHPLFYETTTKLLLQKHENNEAVVKVSGGQSFIDTVISTLNIPINEGFLLLDGTDLSASQLNYAHHTLITQVYDSLSLGEAKLTLLDYYPADTEVKLVDAAGSTDESIHELLLYEIDHMDIRSNLLALYISKVTDIGVKYRDIRQMTEIFDVLVSEDGCPWDKVQTHETLEKYLIEESYEVIEAIEQADDAAIVEELGDILLQVALHSAIGSKNGYFDFFDVLESVNAKVIRRHPHVFGDESAESMDDLNHIWQNAKKKEGKKDKVKYEKEYGEKVLAWMKASIHEERALTDILNRKDD